MRQHVRYAVVAAALSLFVAASAQAQDDHKPGGLNKVAHDVSKTAKKAGRDTKAARATQSEVAAYASQRPAWPSPSSDGRG